MAETQPTSATHLVEVTWFADRREEAFFSDARRALDFAHSAIKVPNALAVVIVDLATGDRTIVTKDAADGA